MAEQPDTMIVADPSLLEEECCKGKMVIGVNAYREVCSQQSIRHASDTQHHEREPSRADAWCSIFLKNSLLVESASWHL